MKERRPAGSASALHPRPPPSTFPSVIQDAPRLGNQWREDRTLRGLLARATPAAVMREIEPSLDHMGALAAGPLLDLAREHRRD